MTTLSISSIFTDIRQLLLPSGCVLCGRPGSWICSRCLREIAREPLLLELQGKPVAVGGDYDRLAPAVLGFKDHGIGGVRQTLVDLLFAAVASVVDTSSVLVPVPSTRAAHRRRGHDVVAELARPVADRVGVPIVPALHWAGRHRTQKGLSAQERAINLRGALQCDPAALPDGAHAIVVDDVLTTGATMVTAMEALHVAGVVVAAGAVVCATHGHFGDAVAPGEARRHPSD